MASFRDIVFVCSSISDVSEALPFVAWLLFARKSKPYSILGIFFAVAFAIKVYTLVTAEYGLNNMHAFHLLSLLEISAVYCFYCEIIYHKIYKWGLAALVVFHVGNTVFNQHLNEMNSLAWTIDMIVIIGFGLVYFFYIYKDDNDYSPLEKRPDFIITVGWLFYAMGALFTYLMATEILTGYADGFFKNGWFFQAASNISKDIIISYGFWLTQKK